MKNMYIFTAKLKFDNYWTGWGIYIIITKLRG